MLKKLINFIKDNSDEDRLSQGFTTFEMTLVLVIIAILLMMLIPKFEAIRLNAKISTHNANVRTIKSSAYLYILDNGIQEGEIKLEDLKSYIDNPEDLKVDKSIFEKENFSITVGTNGDIIVEPGEYEIKNNKAVKKGSTVKNSN